MTRTVPFDPDAVCDSCGKTGAFDFMGDLYCPDCSDCDGRDVMRSELTVSGKPNKDGATTNSYTISSGCNADGQPYFLTNGGGEGMGLSEQNLFDILHDHFKNNF